MSASTYRVVTVAGGALSTRFRVRALAASSVVAVGIVIVMCVQLSAGDYPMSPLDVLRTLTGNGTRGEEYIIYTLRLPRALTAILVGGAFGASGAIFQSITRNPLGSPDIIGFTTGASVGAVLVILVAGGGQTNTALGALAGGMLTSLLVYLLAYRGGVSGYRLILMGIGVTALLGSVISYLLLRARLTDAQNAYVWLVGSLNGRSWSHVVPVGVALVVLLPVTAAMARQLRLLELGDDTAQALGVPVEASRRWLLLLGTALCAVAVSSAGPISFIALAAPQVMRRITGGPIGVLSSALMGSLMLIGSDLAAQRAFPATQVPVGVATLCIGGSYLMWVLYRENRSSRA